MCDQPESSFPDLRQAKTRVHLGRHLPRWEAHGAIYHATVHLADSIPADQLRLWQEIRQEMKAKAATESRPLSDEERQLLEQAHSDHVEKFLSAGYGSCLLRDEDVATSVRNVLTHDDGQKYALHVWCIMPNHIHVIFGGLRDDTTLRATISEWKRISAHAVNKIAGRTGPVWHKDAYTRIIRNAGEYRRQIEYVWHNPEAAGLKSGFLRERYVTGS